LQQREEEKYEREQAESHWNCPFFRHCWNEGLKLPTRNNCPEYSEQYWEFRQSQANRRSIHDRIRCPQNGMDRHIKNGGIHDWLGKRIVDQNWADYEERYAKEEYAW
jgi:transposase-like protein